MSETIIVWKFTRPDGKPTHGKRALPLPKCGKPGRWHDTGEPPVLCRHGVHGCRTLRDALVGGWLNAWLWVAELRGPFAEEPSNKIAGRSGRLLYRVDAWNEQTARLFAADCAETVIKIANDKRCNAAVLAARRYAFGIIDDDAWDAAREATCAAAYAAAMAAAGAAEWEAARAAAWDVAREAAWDAAQAAAYSAARAAAWAAEWAAAWEAARGSVADTLAIRLHDYLTGAVDIEAIKRSVS